MAAAAAWAAATATSRARMAEEVDWAVARARVGGAVAASEVATLAVAARAAAARGHESRTSGGRLRGMEGAGRGTRALCGEDCSLVMQLHAPQVGTLAGSAPLLGGGAGGLGPLMHRYDHMEPSPSGGQLGPASKQTWPLAWQSAVLLCPAGLEQQSRSGQGCVALVPLVSMIQSRHSVYWSGSGWHEGSAAICGSAR